MSGNRYRVAISYKSETSKDFNSLSDTIHDEVRDVSSATLSGTFFVPYSLFFIFFISYFIQADCSEK
jgi:hypothetical protein